MGFRNIKIDSHVKLSIKNQQLYIENRHTQTDSTGGYQLYHHRKSDSNSLCLFAPEDGRYGNYGLCL